MHRGLFWSLVHTIEATIATAPPTSALSQLNTTVVQRYPSNKKFTNFQDQDFIVYDAADTELFSIRFVYSSNAIDFPQRCDLIHNWFFQCLKTAEDILYELLQQEKLRHAQLTRVLPPPLPSIRRPPVGVLYWNTGLWDWRTGVSPQDYERDLLHLLTSSKSNASFSPSFASKVVWRTTSASWPSKFMSGKECAKKPHGDTDTRPCSVHTSTVLDYNRKATAIMKRNSFEVVDSFPITNGRPDLTFDGLHFEKTGCGGDSRVQRDQDEVLRKKCVDVEQMYAHLNEMFLNTICLPER